jgi:hypothetical protein
MSVRDERQGGKTVEDRLKFGSDPLVTKEGERLESEDEQTKAEDVAPPPKTRSRKAKEE